MSAAGENAIATMKSGGTQKQAQWAGIKGATLDLMGGKLAKGPKSLLSKTKVDVPPHSLSGMAKHYVGKAFEYERGLSAMLRSTAELVAGEVAEAGLNLLADKKDKRKPRE